jgi:putative sterol carrier protein
MDFLSVDWAKRYCDVWNEDTELTRSLRNFNNVLHYRYADRDQPPVQLTIENGRCVYAGEMTDPKPDFEMWATAEDWQKITSGDLGIRAAMLTKKLGFKGSMITAMKHMKAFEKSIALMGSVS